MTDGQEKAAGEGKTFEERLQAVQEIIGRIESGTLSLEDSVKQYEQGMKALAALDGELKDVNRRLTVLRDGVEQEKGEGT